MDESNIKRKNNNPGVTAQDVAREAGVSASTVSRVLSGVGIQMIGKATRARVLETANRLGYTPNPIARALRGMQTHLLGLIVREISDPFFATFIAELSGQAHTLGYHIVLGHAHSDAQEALEMSGVLETRQCDGIIILGDLQNDEDIFAKLISDQRSVVALCRGKSPGWIPTINADNSAGMRLLLDHLISLGHQRFALIHGGWLGDVQERRRVFIEYLDEKLGIQVQPEMICQEEDDAEGGYRAMQTILANSPRPTAVCCGDDVMAIGAMQALHDAGVSVPDEISLTGFDDIQMTRFIRPRLTTVRQPVEEMGQRALEMLVDLIERKEIDESSLNIQIMPELVVRESSGTVKGTIKG